MKIRIAKSFNGYRIGQVFDWGDGMARVMIARGLVVPADEPAIERAVAPAADIERAVVDPPVKRKGKPK
jgi:hypothetical protein